VPRHRVPRRLRSEYDSQTQYEAEDEDEWRDTHVESQVFDSARTPYALSTYGEGLTAAVLESPDIKYRPADLFHPSPISSPHSDAQLEADVNAFRPATCMPHISSNSDIYDRYARRSLLSTRRGTIDDPGVYTSDIQTPATSTLIPWAPNESITPVPRLPTKAGHVSSTPRRPAPAAVIAQTPMMQQAGWQGVIPGFR